MFSGCVRRGRNRHVAGVHPGVLSALLPWRAPHVFGIASQIYFRDAKKRREETGWTDAWREQEDVDKVEYFLNNGRCKPPEAK